MADEDEGLTIVLSPAQMAALVAGESMGEHGRLVTRLWGGASLVFSALQMIGGVGLLLVPEPTLTTKVGGGVLLLHGADSGQAAARQLWTGVPTEDLTQQAGEGVARGLGASPKAAYMAGVGLDIAVPVVVSLGLGAERALAIRAGRISLAAEEAAGGHTIARHIGKTEAELQARLVQQPRIRAASTFSSLRVAEDTISDAMKANQAAVKSWAQAARAGETFKVEFSASSAVGSGVVRGRGTLEAMSKVTIILKKTQVGSKIYFVLTAFPRP